VGKRIPFIPVIGEELDVDGKRIMRGIIRPAIDPQRMVNYFYSGAAEVVALGSKAPVLLDPEGIEGYEAMWQTGNVRNYAYLPYRSRSATDNQPISPPTPMDMTGAIDKMVLMLQASEEGIKATTGIFDPSLGNNNPREKSGRAIMALQKQGEAGSSNYIESLKRSLVSAGEILVDIIPKIYDRPGRVLQILDINDELKAVAVGPAPPGQPQPQQPQGPTPAQQKMQAGFEKFYDLKAGRYSVTVDVGKSHTTAREEGVTALSGLVEAAPEYMLPRVGDILVESMDFPGHLKAAERLKKQNPFAQEQDDPAAGMQQMQAQMQQMGQMLDGMTKELNAKNQLLETDGIKAQRDVALAQQKAAAELERLKLEQAHEIRLQEMKNEADLMKAGISARDASLTLMGEAKVGAIERQDDGMLELELQARQHEHEKSKQMQDHAQQAELAVTPPPIDPNAQMAQNDAAAE